VKLLVATRSPGKQREISELLTDLDVTVVFPADQGLWEESAEAGLEDQSSFEGNARRKAEYFARRSGLPTVADDSGLEVFALGGEPGVRSRRFAMAAAGEEQDAANNAELLRRLAGAPAARRRARYRCVLVFLDRPDGFPHSFAGECSGRILEIPAGTGGFGYDPLFHSDDLDQSFGEAALADKQRVSHRGRAFRALAEWLAGRGPS
jgi:XTP/dITP diphosphohydrolase